MFLEEDYEYEEVSENVIVSGSRSNLRENSMPTGTEDTFSSFSFSRFLLESIKKYIFNFPLTQLIHSESELESESDKSHRIRILKHKRNEEFEALEQKKAPCDPHMTYAEGLEAHPHVYHNMSNYFIADSLIPDNNQAAHLEAIAWLEYKKACKEDSKSIKCLNGY